MAKFRSQNEKHKRFHYFEDGEYYYFVARVSDKIIVRINEENNKYDSFNWQNAELIDSKEKQLLLCQLRRKRKTLKNINYQIENIDDYKSGYALIKRNLIANKKIKECEIDSLECALVDVFHMTVEQ